jgi:uncharacterized protein YqeY
MLLDEIRKRMMAAMKAGRAVEKEILRTAMGEITIQEKTGDDEVRAILRKLLKSNQETLALATDEGQRATLAEENAILQEFLPKTLGVDAIVEALAPVRDAIREARNDGQAMGVAARHLKAGGHATETDDVKAAIARVRA